MTFHVYFHCFFLQLQTSMMQKHAAVTEWDCWAPKKVEKWSMPPLHVATLITYIRVIEFNGRWSTDTCASSLTVSHFFFRKDSWALWPAPGRPAAERQSLLRKLREWKSNPHWWRRIAPRGEAPWPLSLHIVWTSVQVLVPPASEF